MAACAFAFPVNHRSITSHTHPVIQHCFYGTTDLQHSQSFNQISKKSGVIRATLSERGEYYSQRPPTPLLDTINYPIHMKIFSIKELKQLADELRSDVIFNVSKTGGHLGSSLGVVELTVVLHYVFNTPQDKILWDVGHQSYPHKILTGRRDQMHTIRQTNGLAGFTKRSESEHDCFGTGHSSTTISAGLGIKRSNCVEVSKVKASMISSYSSSLIKDEVAVVAEGPVGGQRWWKVVVLSGN